MQQSINFEKAYERQHGKKRKTSAGSRAAILMLLCILATGGTGGLIKYHQYELAQESGAVEAFLNTSADALEYERLQGIQDEYSSLRSYNDGIDAMAGMVRDRTTSTRSVYAALKAPAGEGMLLEGLTYSPDGMVAASFSCLSGGDVPAYVETLRSAGFFEAVSYHGWSSEDGYHFQVNCVLKEAVEP